MVSINKNQNSVKGPWLGNNGRLERHTLGRLKSALGVIVNGAATLFQGAKIVGKVAVLPVTYFTKADKSMTPRGIAIDGIGFLTLAKKTGVCFKNTIVAPSLKDRSFSKDIKGTNVILDGELHRISETSSINKIFRAFVLGDKNSLKYMTYTSSQVPS